MIGVALGRLAPVLVGWSPCAAPRCGRGPATHHGHRPIMRESLRNSQALLAFFALSNVDLIVARNVLDRPRRRSVRRRPDPDQGGAVPAAVRGRDRLPVDVDRRRATPGL